MESASEKPDEQIRNHHPEDREIRLKLWKEDPSVLLVHWDELIPKREWSNNRNSNALGRLVIVLTLFRMVLRGDAVTATWQGAVALLASSLFTFNSVSWDEPPNSAHDYDGVVNMPHDSYMGSIGLEEPVDVDEVELTDRDMLKLQQGSRASIGREEFRAANETRIFQREPNHFESDESLGFGQSTVGAEKFVSRKY